MATFVAVHGAFRGGWWWGEVRRRMAVRGHEFWAPSLTGAGERRRDDPDGSAVVRLSTWVDDVTGLLRYEDLRDVVLVGHSQGGVVTTAASQRSADRLGRLVFIDSPVPMDGQRAADFTPAPQGVVIPPMLPPSPLHTSDGISAELAQWVNERLTPCPSAPAFDPVRLDDPVALALPRTYAFCDLTPEQFPCWTTRRRLDADGVPYVRLAAGHDVALSRPDLVVELLESVLPV